MNSDEVIAGQQLQGLQGLPEELLDAVLRQLDASSRLPVFKTSKLLATAPLRVVPKIRLTYPTQHDILGQHLRELAPFLTEVLRNRQQPTLDLTLRPEFGLLLDIDERHKAEPAAAASDAARLVARMLGAVPLCGAVDCLTISWDDSLTISWLVDFNLPWEPAFSATLAATFPSLTSLTFKDVSISIGHLATAINHPLLLPRLLHLDLQSAYITHQGQVGRSPFIGSRLQTLSLSGRVEVDGEREFLSGLLPFPPTLTQLEVTRMCNMDHSGWDRLTMAVRSLTQLQQLSLLDGDSDLRTTGLGPMALLPALAHLPSLHTLVMEECVVGQEPLDALLKLTRITRLEVYSFSGLTTSQASSDCSWRHLEVQYLDWVSAAHLPLHSLTHPLRLQKLVKDTEEPSEEVLAAAELNLCERNKAGLVLDEDLCLSKATVVLLTEQYLSHRTAQQLPHPTVVSSSSHSGPSTSLPSSSSPEGHITPGDPGSSTGQQGHQWGAAAAGGQALMQRLGRCVRVLRIIEQGLGEAHLSSEICLSPANRQALAVLFPKADVRFSQQR